MSKNKKITSPYDLLNREYYKEILNLLSEDKFITSTEIRKKLFPEWKQQRLNKYLSSLYRFGFVVKGPEHKTNTYRRCTPEEQWDNFNKLYDNRKSFDSIVKTLVDIKAHQQKYGYGSKELMKFCKTYPNKFGILSCVSSENFYPIDTDKLNRTVDAVGPKGAILSIESDKPDKPGLTVDYEKILNSWKDRVSIGDYLKYKLEPVKEELENSLTILSKNSRIKITVEYGDGEKFEMT